MKLQELFKVEDYDVFTKKIKDKEFYSKSITKGKYGFRVEVYKCDSGIWKDDIVCVYGANYGMSGLSYPFSIDKIPSYENICKLVNNFYCYNKMLQVKK